jgi:hypothetical protein
MNKKIYYINDLGLPNGIETDFGIQRLPFAHIQLYPWYSVRWDSISSEIKGDGNIVIIQTPVHDEEKKLKIALELSNNNHIFVSQEGTIFDWFDWNANEQRLYIELLSKSKAFLYHSEFDKKLMSVFIDNFVQWNGCINISVDEPKKFGDGTYVSLPTPIKRYQRGMICHKIASDVVKDIPIYSLEYNRPSGIHMLSFPDTYSLDGISIHARMPHDEWMGFIYGSKFGIDIHREFSGGNCSLEYAALGVPLVGNINLDTQRDLFPDLSFDFMDYQSIKKSIHLLLNDCDFYEEVSRKALDNVNKLYHSNTVVEKFRNDFETILNTI